MAIDYKKVGWDTTKFVNPSNMNQMDNGIKAACDGVDALNEKMDDISITSYKKQLTFSNDTEKNFLYKVVKQALSDGLTDGKEVRYIATWSDNDYYLVDCWGMENASIVGFTARSNKGRLIQGKFVVANDGFSWYEVFATISNITTEYTAVDVTNGTYVAGGYGRIGNMVTVNIRATADSNTMQLTKLPACAEGATNIVGVFLCDIKNDVATPNAYAYLQSQGSIQCKNLVAGTTYSINCTYICS